MLPSNLDGLSLIRQRGTFVLVLKCAQDNPERRREAYDQSVTEELRAVGVDLVLLIGYMRILSTPFCEAWEDRCLNVHPSLLPDFAGGMDADVHAEVSINYPRLRI